MSINTLSTEIARAAKINGSECLAFNINEAARVSGLSRSSLYKLLAEGKLPSIKVAGRRLIKRSAIETLLTGEDS